MRLLILLVPLLLAAQPDRFALPACLGPHLELAERHGFITCYDAAQRLPRWTAHQILLAPVAPQPRLSFRPDSQLTHPTPTNRDFARSGFHRGHLVPAADLATDEIAYRDSFLLSNVIPQPPQVNNGIWRRLENAARRLALHADAVLVVTGTLAPPSASAGPLQVPTHAFKVILAISGDTRQIYAALVPNDPSAASLTLADIATTARELEQATGLDFFSALDDPEEELLESSRSILPGPRPTKQPSRVTPPSGDYSPFFQ